MDSKIDRKAPNVSQVSAKMKSNTKVAIKENDATHRRCVSFSISHELALIAKEEDCSFEDVALAIFLLALEEKAQKETVCPPQP